MAYRSDLHCHSRFSFDSESELDDVILTAIDKGLDEIAITDHCDLYQSELLSQLESPFEHETVYRLLCEKREEYKERIKVTVGIEIGQGTERPETVKKLLSEHKYDMVIGSLHSLYRMPDFYLLDFSKITGKQCDLFIAQYFFEIEKMVDWGQFDTLAHLTYPIRYIKAGGHNVDLKGHLPQIERIFTKLIKKGIALEINSSGYRQNLDSPLPSYDLLEIYHKLGGELITVGGDAHDIDDIARFFDIVYDNLRRIGFKYVCSFTERKMQLKEI
ncbi:MAG: histidinol-phosphatase HisJ family protein [Ruminococcaceae bacterium]|nr:histidinol-phosphatase HisJ family protein [Oscillospiraceae bacterium]